MQKVVLPGDAARETPAVGPILLIGDDRFILASIGGQMRASGFEVIEALDYVTALEACLSKSPTLAVIDSNVPDSNGIQLAQQITEHSRVPFVFLSASGDEATISAAVAAGAMAYLVKPIDPPQIIPVVRAALRRSQELRALQSQTERLTAAVRTGKQIAIATGLVMANLNLDQQDAFERLRRQARARRTRLEDFAAELLRVADEAGVLYRSLETPDAPRRRSGEQGGAGEFDRANG